MRVELVSRVHKCNVWVRACGQDVETIFMEEGYAEYKKDYCADDGDDYGDGDGGCRCYECCGYEGSEDEDYECCAGSSCRPLEPSKEWLAACPAMARANMRVAANARPPLARLLGRQT